MFSVRGKRVKKGTKAAYIIIVLLLLAAAVTGFFAIREQIALNRDKKRMQELSAMVNDAVQQPPAQEVMPAEPEVQEEADGLPLSEYAEIKKLNDDVYGWVKIDGTPVDYPVMYTPDDPEKYLRRNFDGQYSAPGTIFMDYRCTENSDNQILYGHYMKNGTMFGSILKYADQAYWEEHPVIHYDTLTERRDYQVLAAFYDRVHRTDETCFKYYNFVDAADRDDYENALRNYRELALYDTGVEAEYGDQLLTLSTCSYHEKMGRFVVIAVEME